MKDAIFLLIGIPFTATLRGFVLAKLWDWFIVSHFGVAPLRIPIALGISTIVGLLTLQVMEPGKKNTEPLYVFIYGIFASLMALGFGAIYRLFL